MPVFPGDVLVVDEATQVCTEDALRIAQIARRSGAMVVGTFDPEQLGAVDAGGIFPLIAARHGSYRLTEVRRFTSAWEREASLKLREGDVSALAEYAGPRADLPRPAGPGVRRRGGHVPQRLAGRRGALLMATSNATAVRLAGLVRERLIEWAARSRRGADDAVGRQPGGHGDLIRARLNTRIDADGQALANRDVVRLESVTDSAHGRLAAVRRQTGPDEWSARSSSRWRTWRAPPSWPTRATSTSPRAAPWTGRTWWWTASANRSSVYVGATRAREKNIVHVVTGPPDPAQPTRAEREAYAQAQRAGPPTLRKAGREDLAREISIRMPDGPANCSWPRGRRCSPRRCSRTTPSGPRSR